MKRRMILTALVLIVLASPATAYLLENTDFGSDLLGWTQESGTWTHQPGDGQFGFGSAEVSSEVGANSLTQCASLESVGPEEGLYFLAFARTVNHTSPVQISLEVFASDDCSGGPVDTRHFQVDNPPLDAWTAPLYIVANLPAGGAGSARAWLTAHAVGEGEITRFDFAGLTDNLAPNAHFTDDISGWVVNTGTWSQVSGDGNGTPLGAAQATLVAGSAFISQCLNLNAAPRSSLYFGGAWFKALDVLEDYVMSFQFRASEDCTGPNLSEPGLLIEMQQLNTWERYSTGLAPPLEANSLALFIGVESGTSASRFLVDSVVLSVSVRNNIFEDGFESGDTSRW